MGKNLTLTKAKLGMKKECTSNKKMFFIKMRSSPLRVETKFVSLEEMKYIILNDIVEINIRYELYRIMSYV